MKRLVGCWRRIGAYAAHDDPLTSCVNWIALVVVWNQPFYPLYLYAIVGGDKLAPSLLTFLSTPFFLAVPWLSKRHPLGARLLLPLTGMANAVVSTKAFGVGSGVELFLIPCALIAAALFRPAERAIGLTIIAGCAAIYFGLHDRYGAPLAAYSTAESAAMLGLNAVSAATLTVFIGVLLSGVVDAAERRAFIPEGKSSGSAGSPGLPKER
ncbi:hypothetical protein [Mesorhizobium sp. CN2-181]|uniref:hypothetical protein n=1 Tax=Mesorhizobium yinganensis TaxID=3157707 RepID=UPI0032B873DB